MQVKHSSASIARQGWIWELLSEGLILFIFSLYVCVWFPFKFPFFVNNLFKVAHSAAADRVTVNDHITSLLTSSCSVIHEKVSNTWFCNVYNKLLSVIMCCNKYQKALPEPSPPCGRWTVAPYVKNGNGMLWCDFLSYICFVADLQVHSRSLDYSHYSHLEKSIVCLFWCGDSTVLF